MMAPADNFSDDFIAQLAALKERAATTVEPWAEVLRCVAAIPPLPPEAATIRLASTIEGDYLLAAESVLVGTEDGRSVVCEGDQKSRLDKARKAIWQAAPPEVLDLSYALRGTVFRQDAQNAALHKVYDELWFPLLRQSLPSGLFDGFPVAVKCGLFDFDGGLLEISLHEGP